MGQLFSNCHLPFHLLARCPLRGHKLCDIYLFVEKEFEPFGGRGNYLDWIPWFDPSLEMIKFGQCRCGKD